MGKLDHVKDKVIKMLAVGNPQTSIAGQVGVDQSTVSRFANKDEVVQLIEVEQEKLVAVLPDAVANVKSLVEGMKDVPEDDVRKLGLCYKASTDVLKATNAFPSPQYAHNIYNDNSVNNTAISPEYMAFLKFQASRNNDGKPYYDEIVEAEGAEVTEDSGSVN